MSRETPTTQQINDNLIAQLEASLNQAVPLLPKSFLRVLARTLSGVFIILYKYVGFMLLQQFVRHASFKETNINGILVTPLIEWGALVGVGDPTRATAAELKVTVYVEKQSGSLPPGTQLVQAATRQTYVTAATVELNAPTVDVLVRATEGSGSAGNLQPGAILSFANPLANVARDAIVVSQEISGADAEGERAYRQRVLDRFQKRPQGGAYSDYEQWGEETPGVLNIYPYTGERPGTVDIYVEATPESSGSRDGIPTAAQLLAVRQRINQDTTGLASRRPANALVNTYPITRLDFAVNIYGLQVDYAADVKTQITQALQTYFFNREPFIIGLSALPRQDRVTRSALGGVVDAIVGSRGGIFSNVTLTLDGFPIELYTLNVGEKAKISGVNFL